MQKEGVPVEDQHITLQLPTMYGDHHTSKVRQILTALPGVKNVTAILSAVTNAHFDVAVSGQPECAFGAVLTRGYNHGQRVVEHDQAL